MNFFSLIILYLTHLYLIKSDLFCQKCNHKITEVKNLFDIKSTEAIASISKIKYKNSSVITHIFKNPQNVYFEVITSTNAKLYCQKESYEEYSFFGGYAWSSCICAVCGTHHGWLFTPIKNFCVLEEEDKQCLNRIPFYGIITNGIEYIGNTQNERIEL